MANWLKRITPVLLVEEIEPCLQFWESQGFDKTTEVPHGERLGFVILEKSGLEIMYQTRASVAEDIPALAGALGGGTFLFLEVMDLDVTIELLGDAPVVLPRRKTFYGMEEIVVREPGGHTVTFAMPVSE